MRPPFSRLLRVLHHGVSNCIVANISKPGEIFWAACRVRYCAMESERYDCETGEKHVVQKWPLAAAPRLNLRPR